MSGTVAGLVADEHRHVMSTYRRLPVEFVRGDGFNLYDSEGREYLDFVAGIAVNVLGHGHERLLRAIERQARRMVHSSNLYYTQPQVELARQLGEVGFPGRAFFANSGAEANEAAIKIARKWGRTRRDGAFAVISAAGSFHGRTLATLAATGQPKYQAPFGPMPAGFSQVPFNDIGALRQACDSTTAAILLEPIQGESGIIPADIQYLREVRELCDREEILLIFDEVQTGMGRTGTFFAFQGMGVTPDVVTLAKGLGGGIPIGVCLAAPHADVLEPGDHGSTFGGNPLACAAALAVISVITETGVLDRVAATGQHLRERLEALGPEVAEVRGRGLMVGVGLADPIAGAVQAEALQRGLVVNAIGDRTLRLVPPLTIGRPEVIAAVRVLGESLGAATRVVAQ